MTGATRRTAPDDPGIIRPVWARIDLGCVRHNVRYLDGLTGDDCAFMAVVKADAYGHGAVPVARAALDAGAECLGVALLEEALDLREERLDCPLYLLFEAPCRGARRAVEADVICSVYTMEYARALAGAARSLGKTALVHLKIDSGMHRVGVPAEDAAAFASQVEGLEGLEVTGIYTHFAVADRPDDPFTTVQLERFEQAAAAAESALGRRLLRHAANSAALMAHPRSHFDMVRVGIAMLGLHPSQSIQGTENLRPALTLSGEVAFAKRVQAGEGISYGLTFAPDRASTIATLPIGYADGLSRLLSGKAEVLIGGKRRPLVGTICMDVCMADLGDDPVEKGDTFIIIGADGSERITAEEVAVKLGTINYEVVCMISSRVPRVFVAAGTGGTG